VRYREIPFARFALGLGIAAIPVLILEREAPKWAWAYVVLLMLGFLVVNTDAVARGAAYFSSQLRSG
jgi:hypothetical protein